MTRAEAPEQLDIRPLAENFYRAVCSSGRFSWMGVFETKDALQRARLPVVLKEKTHSSTKELQHYGRVGILPAFRELLFAFRPNVFLDLYFNRSDVDDPKQLVESCIEDFKDQYGTDDHKPEIELLWEGELSEST